MATKQPSPQQLAALTNIAFRVMVNHGVTVGEIHDAMQNFEIPAQRSINAGFARMGIARFTSAGDDVWEMITALETSGPNEYQRSPRHLVDRWGSY